MLLIWIATQYYDYPPYVPIEQDEARQRKERDKRREDDEVIMLLLMDRQHVQH